MTATTPSAIKVVSLVWLVSGSWGPDFSEDTTGLADFGVTGGVGGVGVVRVLVEWNYYWIPYSKEGEPLLQADSPFYPKS